jgi:hypothetical protein
VSSSGQDACDSALSPSIVWLGGEQVAVTYVEFFHPNSVAKGRVYTRHSSDGGQYWQIAELHTSTTHSSIWASSAEFNSGSQHTVNVVYRGDASNQGDIRSDSAYLYDNALVWRSGYSNVDDGNQNLDYYKPTVYHHPDWAGCAYEGNTGVYNLIFNKWTNDGEWSVAESALMPADGNYYNPTAMTADRTNNAWEFVMCEKHESSSKLYLAKRNRPEAWTAGFFLSGTSDNLWRPNLWGEDNALNLVYTRKDAGSGVRRVFFTRAMRSDDGGETWGYLDAPDYGGKSCIALSSSGSPWCSYVRDCTLYVAVMNPDSGWTVKALYAGDANRVLGPPSLALFHGTSGRLANVAFPVYNTEAGASMIMYAQADSAGNVVLDTADLFSGSYGDSCVSIAVGVSDSVWLTYSRGDSVYFRELSYAPNNGDRPDTWSCPYRINSVSTTGRQAFLERFKNNLYAAYREQDANGRVVIRRRAKGLAVGAGTWGSTENMSASDTLPKGWPVLSTDHVTAWVESTGTHWSIKAKVGDSTFVVTGDSKSTPAATTPRPGQ